MFLPGWLDRARRSAVVLIAGGILGCAGDPAAPGGVTDGVTGAGPPPPAPPSTLVPADLSDQPLTNLSAAGLARFQEGDRLFGTPFRLPDGLGPLYIRT